jgi:hypothetical protein
MMTIINAKKTKINSYSHLPNMADTLTDWFLDIDMIKITKSVVDFEVVETEKAIKFKGVVQNLDSKQLQLKPEGQRAWSWKMIHCHSSLELNVDDIIIYGDVRYRVMNLLDYKEYGYLEYHIVKDFENGSN